MPDLQLIPQEHVETVWRLGSEFIKQAMALGEFSEDELREQCADGSAQLWYAWSDHLEAAAVTSQIDTPQGRVCVLLACGGKDRKRWLCLLDEIEKWAAKQGCKVMRIYGRKGWARALKDYRVARLILDKEL